MVIKIEVQNENIIQMVDVLRKNNINVSKYLEKLMLNGITARLTNFYLNDK